MTSYLFHVYLEENSKWQQTLNLQREELPAMLASLTQFIRITPLISLKGEASDLYFHLEQQAGIIDLITEKIKTQQQRLETYREQYSTSGSAFNAFYDQEELRDELLLFEKNHLKFKQQFHQYLLLKP